MTAASRLPPVLFDLGQLVITKAALHRLTMAQIPPVTLIQRHVTGDFGDVQRSDVDANLQAIAAGLRLLSKYGVGDDAVYVITEADRSSTCILLVEEY